MRVLVSGGAGYIGSVVQLVAAGHDVVVVDSFANAKPSVVGRVEALTGQSLDVRSFDLTDHDKTEHLFAHEDVDAVIHFAGFKAVGESVAKPLEYYENNLGSTFSLSARCAATAWPSSSSPRPRRSTAPTPVPMREDLPTSATNYGWTKVMQEQVLRDVAVADPTWRIALLRYFNPVGAHPSGTIGEDPSDIPNNLMPYIAQVAVGRREKLLVFGGDYPARRHGVRLHPRRGPRRRPHRRAHPSRRTPTSRRGTSAPATAPRCSSCSTRSSGPAATSSPTRSSTVARATSPRPTPTPHSPRPSSAGAPPAPSTTCAPTPGAGRARTRTATPRAEPSALRCQRRLEAEQVPRGVAERAVPHAA